MSTDQIDQLVESGQVKIFVNYGGSGRKFSTYFLYAGKFTCFIMIQTCPR